MLNFPFANATTLNNCHPERSEGSAVPPNDGCPILARRVRKGGIPRQRRARDLAVDFAFGWRSASALRLIPVPRNEREGHGFSHSVTAAQLVAALRFAEKPSFVSGYRFSDTANRLKPDAP
jgi:hypothetical protein